MSRRSPGDLSAGIFDRARVDPEDASNIEPCDQARHRAAGTDGTHHVVEPRALFGDLLGGESVTMCPNGIRTPEGNEGRPAALRAHRRRSFLGGDRQRLVRRPRLITGPDDGGAEEFIEYEVAASGFAWCPGKDEEHVESQACARGGGKPCVVRLGCARGDHRVCALGDGGRQGPLEFANLVTSGREAGEIVAFEPQILGMQADGRS